MAHGRLDKAEAAYRKCPGHGLRKHQGHLQPGHRYLKGENTEDAGEIFGKIMSLDLAFGPEQHPPVSTSSASGCAGGMREAALSYYRKAVALNDLDEHLYFNMARIHVETGDYRGAGECLDKALEINPGFAVAAKMRKSVARLAGMSGGQPAS
jgi:tetratricopeptide (TPR) repeat protein